MSNTILLSFITLYSLSQIRQDFNANIRKKVTGQAEYCVMTENEITCADHTLAQCLRSLYLTQDGIVCESRKDMYNIVFKRMLLNYVGRK